MLIFIADVVMLGRTQGNQTVPGRATGVHSQGENHSNAISL